MFLEHWDGKPAVTGASPRKAAVNELVFTEDAGSWGSPIRDL